MLHAVITADIVSSSQLPRGKKVWFYDALEAYLKHLADQFRFRLEWYRGDSFQIRMDNAGAGLRLGLLIRTKIRSLYYTGKEDNNKELFDVRMALGIGEIDFDRPQVASSDGAAFRLSGRGLDQLKPGKQLFTIATEDQFRNELRIESLLLDTLINGTTMLQCEVINLKLHGFTEVEIADALKIGQPAVNQRSVAGNWQAINEMTIYFEQLYKS